MKKISLLFVLYICCLSVQAQNARTILFDNDWRFKKENPSQAESPSFDDKDWRKLDLPHDWMIEDLPNQTQDSIMGPFSKASIAKMGTGFTVGGTAWYRKNFTINAADKGKIAYLQFDGVYMNADVWVNGKHLGNHAYGYTSFWYDITPYLNPAGKPNVVAVQVKNEGMNARWYSGSGIYRHTWLTLVNPVHVAPWGTYVTTPEVSEKKATVEVATNITNSSKKDVNAQYVVKILNPAGAEVGKAIMKTVLPAGQSTELKQVVSVENPTLWSLENPKLCKAQVELLVDGKVQDKLNSTFGIRSIHFDSKTGFTLNGKNIKMKGGCFHHDHGPLGAASIDRAEERKLELLKKAGFNALRCSHNPPSPYFLDVCDRLGILVINETFDMWEKSKLEGFVAFFGKKGEKYDIQDYSTVFKSNWQKDIQSILLRDRNHPSIIMWSIGNEIGEAADSSGLRIATNLAKEVKKFDRTRAVTEGHVDAGAFTGGETWERRKDHFALMDVIGYNYGVAKYKKDHEKYPERVIYASEFNPSLALEYYNAMEELPYIIGNFTWTAMDYIGEAGAGYPRLKPLLGKDEKPNAMADLLTFFQLDSWPVFGNFQGDLDLIGNPKVAYYYSHVVWRDHKLSMFVHTPIPAGKRELVSKWGFPDELKSWNWEGHEGEKMQVHVYTRSKLVKLELNGKIVGEQAIDDSKSITATFEVPYESGTLIARCFDNGVEMASETIKTVGKPAAIRLSADRSSINADRNDLSYVMVEVIDAEGNIVPNSDNVLVNFDINGNGEIAGVGNGNPIDLSSFQQPKKKSWQGKCLAIVRPKGDAGKIILKANANGLKGAVIEILTKK